MCVNTQPTNSYEWFVWHQQVDTDYTIWSEAFVQEHRSVRFICNGVQANTMDQLYRLESSLYCKKSSFLMIVHNRSNSSQSGNRCTVVSSVDNARMDRSFAPCKIHIRTFFSSISFRRECAMAWLPKFHGNPFDSTVHSYDLMFNRFRTDAEMPVNDEIKRAHTNTETRFTFLALLHP